MHLILLSLSIIFLSTVSKAAGPIPEVVLAIHGGSSDHEEIPANMEKPILEGLVASLKAGYAALQTKGTSLDAVEAAVRSLEDNPLFNAGKGAVFSKAGLNELDASIMEGKTKRAGAVASVTTIKNPISAARAVMEKTRHVLLVSKGAEQFAKESGLEIVKPSYFRTERRYQEWKEAQKQEALKKQSSKHLPWNRHFSLGTTGAVALDNTGTVAAATSTGGLTNKMHGRVGDSPIIGAGTYADNEGAAVSCTGIGEFFIRFGVAHEIIALIKHKSFDVKKASDQMIQATLKPMNVEGAAIVLDPKGNLAFSYNSEYLPRGYVTRDGKIHTFINDKEAVIKVD